MTIAADIQTAILHVPAGAWTRAYDGGGQVREATWVADITGLLDLDGWSAGTRASSGKERSHLELRDRRRARCEDRIRCAKETGLRNLPHKSFAQNQLWCGALPSG